MRGVFNLYFIKNTDFVKKIVKNKSISECNL